MASRKEQERLITLIRSKAPEAWDEFFNHYSPDINMQIRNSRFKDKVLDDANIILIESARESFDYVEKSDKQIQSLNALVWYITRAVISRYFRKKKGEEKLVLLDNLDRDISTDEADPEESLTDKEAAHRLKICMARLTKTQEMTLRLWMEGNSWAKVARMRRVSQAAIVQVRDAAFQRLRECMNEM